jgi:hypothetical protein
MNSDNSFRDAAMTKPTKKVNVAITDHELFGGKDNDGPDGERVLSAAFL